MTIGFGENTEEMDDAGLMGFRAVVAPPEATGTVRFRVDGKDFGSPVPVKGGIADAEPMSLSRGRVHSVEAEYSGDASFEPSRDEWKNVRWIGDGQAEEGVAGSPGFQPSGLLIALVALALLAGARLVYRKNKGGLGSG